MSNYEILEKSFFESIIYFVLFLIISISIFLIRRRNEQHKQFLIIEEKEDAESLDMFGFEDFKDSKQFQKDVVEIMKTVDDGKQVKVPFAKAMYILKNFKNYNVFSSEDNRIIFDKLKTLIDEEVEIDQTKTINKNIEVEKITASTKPFDITNEKLEDGSIKVYNPNGYTIMKDSLIVSCVNYADEIKKLEHEKRETNNGQKVKELEEKIKSLEDVLLNNLDETKKIKKTQSAEKKKEVIEQDVIDSDEEKVEKENIIDSMNYEEKVVPKIEDKTDANNLVSKDEQIEIISNKLNEDLENFFENFENDKKTQEIVHPDIKAEISSEIIQEAIPEVSKTIIIPIVRKDFSNIVNTFPLLEDYNLVFILQSFNEAHEERIHLLVKWLMDYNNLADLDNGLMFIDMDLDKNIFYVDMYLFLYLFSNFYADKKNFLNIFTISNQVVNVNAIKKLMHEMNLILANKYEQQFFKFVGKSESPFAERVISYDIDGKKIFSAQMIMINLDIEEKEFEQNINEIKTHLVGRFRPQIHKAKFNNEKEEKVKTLGFDYFKDYFLSADDIANKEDC